MSSTPILPNNIILEACIETVAEALHAEANGAQQLEVCSRLDLDGLTPEWEFVKDLQEQCQIPLKIMIRPRAGNFFYSKEELACMLDDIEDCQKAGITEIVLGPLTRAGTIDLASLKTLSQAAGNMAITFHKAFDLIKDPLAALEQFQQFSNLKYVLSSGQEQTAWEGRHLLREMQAKAGDNLQFIVAGKVRSHNINELHQAIGAKYYHGRGIV